MASPLLLLWGDGDREPLVLVLLEDLGGRLDGFGGRSDPVTSADWGSLGGDTDFEGALC